MTMHHNFPQTFCSDQRKKYESRIKRLRKALVNIVEKEDCPNCQVCAPCGWGTQTLKGYAREALKEDEGDWARIKNKNTRE